VHQECKQHQNCKKTIKGKMPLKQGQTITEKKIPIKQKQTVTEKKIPIEQQQKVEKQKAEQQKAEKQIPTNIDLINDITKLFNLQKNHVIEYKEAIGANNCGIFLIADNDSQIPICQLQSSKGPLTNTTVNFCSKLIKCIDSKNSKIEFKQLKEAEKVGIGPKIFGMKIKNNRAYILQENLPYGPLFRYKSQKMAFIDKALDKLYQVYKITGLYNNDPMAILQIGCRKNYMEATIDDYLIYDWGLVTDDINNIKAIKKSQQEIATVFLQVVNKN
jgi:hypothetical protein